MKRVFLVLALGLVCASSYGQYTPPLVGGSPGPQGSPGISGSPGPAGPQGSPGPDTIASTTAVLKGDNAGGAVAATAGTDYATVAQAAHSGGVIGTAAFNPSGGSIQSPSYTGIVSGVTYTNVGVYAVTFSANQADVDYGINLENVASTPNDPIIVAVLDGSKVVGGFSVILFKGTPGGGGTFTFEPAEAPDRMTITVTRLSQ